MVRWFKPTRNLPASKWGLSNSGKKVVQDVVGSSSETNKVRVDSTSVPSSSTMAFKNVDDLVNEYSGS